jgi:hypothetical protein
MAAVPIYWLDTNVFIQAKNGPYKFKVFGVFWAFLHEQIDAGTIRCPKMVYQEIVKNEEERDDLANWIKTRRQSGLFVDSDPDVQRVMNRVADHVIENYAQQHAGHFLSGADPWLIAHAIHTEGTVVTHESAKRPDAKTARIPDVCDAFKVPCIDTYEMRSADSEPTSRLVGRKSASNGACADEVTSRDVRLCWSQRLPAPLKRPTDRNPFGNQIHAESAS